MTCFIATFFNNYPVFRIPNSRLAANFPRKWHFWWCHDYISNTQW